MFDKKFIRNFPEWKDCPVPLCSGGDFRALTFCCKPGLPLNFGFKCLRDQTLQKLDITKEEFIKIKQEFSEKEGWDDKRVCFGSLSYCCLRSGGCPGGRDISIKERYSENSFGEYLKRKRLLAIEILKHTKNEDARKLLEYELNKEK